MLAVFIAVTPLSFGQREPAEAAIASVAMAQTIDDPKTSDVIATFKFWSQPRTGQLVTVISLLPGSELSGNSGRPFKIVKVRTQHVDCGDTGLRWWGIATLKPVRRYYSYVHPIPALVIYPAVAFAQALSIERISPDSLPQHTSDGGIIAAIDLDDDGQPDLVVTECDSTTLAGQRCRCFDYHLKKAGVWTLLRHQAS